MLLVFGAMIVPVPANAAVDPAPPIDAGPLRRIRVGDEVRTYRLFIPHRLRTRAPLIVALHGGGRQETGQRMEATVGLDAEAVKRRWIVAYPDAIGGQFNAGRCCNAKRPDDTRFIRRLVAQIKARHAVNSRRVYAVGFSAGGMMAYRLACQASDVFAAIAVVAGTEVVTPCAPTRPVSVLHIHARNDPRLAYLRGRFGSPSIPALNRIWRRRDRCADSQTITIGVGVTLARAPCSRHTSVELLTGDNFGHTWPGAMPPYSSDAPSTFSATDAIGHFLHAREHEPALAGRTRAVRSQAPLGVALCARAIASTHRLVSRRQPRPGRSGRRLEGGPNHDLRRYRAHRRVGCGRHRDLDRLSRCRRVHGLLAPVYPATGRGWVWVLHRPDDARGSLCQPANGLDDSLHQELMPLVAPRGATPSPEGVNWSGSSQSRTPTGTHRSGSTRHRVCHAAASRRTRQ
jgi:polyhydroxybutyrate depolymerase